MRLLLHSSSSPMVLLVMGRAQLGHSDHASNSSSGLQNALLCPCKSSAAGEGRPPAP